jgi:hypothetical protein
MNPDKLFDYLDGTLPDWERSQLEKEMAEDPQLQKEFAAARRIHSNMRGDSRELIIQDDTGSIERGRKIALRVGIAFVILIALNVAAGLFFIARHESANPNRKLLEDQMRDQISKSLRQATHAALTPPPLGLGELTIPVGPGQLNPMADQVAAVAKKLGGNATKELPDGRRVGVLVDVPAQRESDFRTALSVLTGVDFGPALPNDSTGGGAEKRSFIVHVVEGSSR